MRFGKMPRSCLRFCKASPLKENPFFGPSVVGRLFGRWSSVVGRRRSSVGQLFGVGRSRNPFPGRTSVGTRPGAMESVWKTPSKEGNDTAAIQSLVRHSCHPVPGAPLATAAALATTDGQVAAHGSSIAALQSSLTTSLSNKADQSALDVLEAADRVVSSSPFLLLMPSWLEAVNRILALGVFCSPVF